MERLGTLTCNQACRLNAFRLRLLLLLCAVVAATACARPPSDAQLVSRYQLHHSEFQRLAAFARADDRLTQLGQSEASQKGARSAGASAKDIDEYVAILRSVGANQGATSVYGLGRAWAIVYDVGGGIDGPVEMRGYVLDPADPKPLVPDIGHWRPNTRIQQAPIAYKPLDGGWYLFRLQQ